jgi:hypothetical protein
MIEGTKRPVELCGFRQFSAKLIDPAQYLQADYSGGVGTAWTVPGGGAVSQAKTMIGTRHFPAWAKTLVEIGAKAVDHGRSVTFGMADVAMTPGCLRRCSGIVSSHDRHYGIDP